MDNKMQVFLKLPYAVALIWLVIGSAHTVYAQKKATPKTIYFPTDSAKPKKSAPAPSPRPTPKLKPTQQPKDGPRPNYMVFRVTISGDGDTGDGTVWSVDRTYESGLITLDRAGMMFEDGMTEDEIRKEMSDPGKANRATRDVPVTITINDKLKTEGTEPCPDPAEGDRITTNTKTWSGKGTIRNGGLTMVKRWSSSETLSPVFNLQVPLYGTETPDSPVRYLETTTAGLKLTIKKNLHFPEVPDTGDILRGGLIRHSKPQPVDIVDYTESSFSRTYTPNTELLPGVRDSRYESKITVEYIVSGNPSIKLSPRVREQ